MNAAEVIRPNFIETAAGRAEFVRVAMNIARKAEEMRCLDCTVKMMVDGLTKQTVIVYELLQPGQAHECLLFAVYLSMVIRRFPPSVTGLFDANSLTADMGKMNI